MEVLLAQHASDDGGGSFTMTVLALLAMLVGWLALGYVAWIFWKAKKRDEAEERRRDEWRNAPSS